MKCLLFKRFIEEKTCFCMTFTIFHWFFKFSLSIVFINRKIDLHVYILFPSVAVSVLNNLLLSYYDSNEFEFLRLDECLHQNSPSSARLERAYQNKHCTRLWTIQFLALGLSVLNLSVFSLISAYIKPCLMVQDSSAVINCDFWGFLWKSI